jgi:Putative peptidoglycan binding domain
MRILVVGLAAVLAAAGSAFADGNSSNTAVSSSTVAGRTSSTVSSVSSAAPQGGAHPTIVSHSSGNRAPVARSYPADVAVQNRVPVNAPRLHLLDRSELLARQAAYFNRNRLSSVPVQSAEQNEQSKVNARQVANGGDHVAPPGESVIQARHHRGDSQNEANGTRATNGINGINGTNGRPIPATNTSPHRHRPVLNFNNSDTMSFTDACRRHREHHDCNWWRNHCTTIILVGGGFYAWDLGYWYPAYGYDPYNSDYAYDGPIYGYDGLPPDQIIANVQYALQQLGYFSEEVDGVLGAVTRSAIEDYQVENNLPVTGAIDRPLLISLGLIY